jgi:hypothetical protein
MMWFGESWGAPVCEPEQHTATPVGRICVECDNPVEDGDTGFVMPVTNLGSLVYHRVCFLRTVIPCEMWDDLLKTDMTGRWRRHWEGHHAD